MLLGSGELGKEVVIEFQSFPASTRHSLKQTRSSDYLASLKFEVKDEWEFAWQKEAASRKPDEKPTRPHQIFSIP